MIAPSEPTTPSHRSASPVHGRVARLSLRLLDASMRRPRRVMTVVAIATALCALMFVRVQIDTDPENMLPADATVRVLNAELRAEFDTGDMVVVGFFAQDTGRGSAPTSASVVSADAFNAVAAFHEELAATDGVAEETLISVRSGFEDRDVDTGAAVVDDDDAVALAERIAADPLLGGNVLSADGDTFAVFIPLDDKSDAQAVAAAAEASWNASPELSAYEFQVAGLPLAQEAFGDQMFIQMGVFAPLAGVAIFVLMWLFFRRLVLVLPAMLLAMLAVIWTMGLLIGTGNTLHIMSSMIPIFLMPIAILDSIHVISEFFDRYALARDRNAALRAVYAELAGPIAFTTITTFVAFAALSLTPIPPVRVFGIFVAVGVVLAWLGTLTVLPAVLMLVDERRIARAAADGTHASGPLAAAVRRIPRFAIRHRRGVVASAGLVAILAVPFITRIEVNDNPVNWFEPGHEVRVATERLNAELPGTFGASLSITAESADLLVDPRTTDAIESLQATWRADETVGTSASYVDLLGGSTGAPATSALDELRTASPLTSTLINDDGTWANVRLQLRDGDNQAMQSVIDSTEAQLAAAPLPDGVTVEWAGETYLNLVWQQEMVEGMLVGFLLTLVVVFALLVGLFRSLRWALLAIAPVLWTVLVVYGVIGLIGKDFDMPIAVLSTLVLGIGVDFAIHFVERYRELWAEYGGARQALSVFAEEPARALTRNALVIAVGFLPLLFSSLTPYVIVGIFLASIIVLSWLATVMALPAIVAGPADDQRAQRYSPGTATSPTDKRPVLSTQTSTPPARNQ